MLSSPRAASSRPPNRNRDRNPTPAPTPTPNQASSRRSDPEPSPWPEPGEQSPISDDRQLSDGTVVSRRKRLGEQVLRVGPNPNPNPNP